MSVMIEYKSCICMFEQSPCTCSYIEMLLRFWSSDLSNGREKEKKTWIWKNIVESWYKISFLFGGFIKITYIRGVHRGTHVHRGLRSD